MSLIYIAHFLFDIFEIGSFEFNIYEYKTPKTNIRKWNKDLNAWTIPLLGPPLIEPDTRRNPAVYGYKNGYIISIFNLNENRLISIKDFMYNFSLNNSFIECLYSVLTSNNLFTYFEMQTPCFSNLSNDLDSDYMVNETEIMYIYVSGQIKNSKCNMSYKEKDVNGDGGLWDKFKKFVNNNPSTRIEFIDENMKYDYKQKTYGNNSMLVFDPYYENGINHSLKNIYLDADENIIKDNDYCNIGSLFHSTYVTNPVKINYLKFIF